jgi:hypothetical protein
MNPDYEFFFQWWESEGSKMFRCAGESPKDHVRRVSMYAWLNATLYIRNFRNQSSTPES